jgi:hypothetical protein
MGATGKQGEVVTSSREWGDCKECKAASGRCSSHRGTILAQAAFPGIGTEAGKEGAGRVRSNSELPQAKTGEVGPFFRPSPSPGRTRLPIWDFVHERGAEVVRSCRAVVWNPRFPGNPTM